MTQPSKGPVPAGTTGEPAAPRNPAVEDLDVAKDAKDADADRVKGGVKKTMQT